jgi:hypothetical protein
MLGKQLPLPQQFTPGAVLHAVSQSESTLHVVEVLHVLPPLSSPVLPEEPGVEPLSLPEELEPLEVLPPELPLPVEASLLAFLGVNPDVLLFEPPQAAMKPTAVRLIVRLRIEPIFIWRLPSAAPKFGAHISVWMDCRGWGNESPYYLC